MFSRLHSLFFLDSIPAARRSYCAGSAGCATPLAPTAACHWHSAIRWGHPRSVIALSNKSLLCRPPCGAACACLSNIVLTCLPLFCGGATSREHGTRRGVVGSRGGGAGGRGKSISMFEIKGDATPRTRVDASNHMHFTRGLYQRVVLTLSPTLSCPTHPPLAHTHTYTHTHTHHTSHTHTSRITVERPCSRT